MQEKFLGVKKDLWMAFVDLKMAFDRVPWQAVWWALRKMRVEEWQCWVSYIFEVTSYSCKLLARKSN
jgi:hypothetical protein